MSRKALTQEEVESYCESQGYRVLSPYINSSTKIKLQNIKTGEIGEMRFSNFKKGKRFDNSKAKTKLTQQEVEEYCLEQDYRVLSPYINNSTKIKLQNIETGEIGEMTFGSFKQGNRFDTKKGRKKLTQQEVEDYCLERDYKLLSKFVNSKTKIKLQNIETNEIGEMLFSSFKQGHRFDANKLTYQQYIKPFINEGYTVLTDGKDYKNVTVVTKIDVTCPNNHQWVVRRSTFTSLNQRCPMCNQDTGGMSIGEKMVYQILQGNNITFEREKSIYIDEKLYRFDFYFEVEEFGYTDKFIIEYDGEQHYHEGSGYLFGGLKQRRTKDEIKNKYAHDNNICIVRIPWMNDTMDKILYIINGETGLDLHSVDVTLPTIQEISDYYLTHSIEETMDKFNISDGTVKKYFKQIHVISKTKYLGASKQEVATYYLTYSVEATMSKFNISSNTVFNYFIQIYGMSKFEYLGISKQEISDYYLIHTLKETGDRFNIGSVAIRNYFKQIHGISKTEYLGATKQEVADYYLSHTLKETYDEFNISDKTVRKYFNQIYGMGKTEYLKIIDTTK